MRLLALIALVVVFPTVAPAEFKICFDASDEQHLREAMGTGPDAIERAVTFFSELYGTPPELEKRMPDKSVLKWTVPTQPGLATTFVRYITIKTGRRLSVSCDTTF